MRICFFNRSYWPDFGATGQLLTELSEDLVQKHGCEVSVVVGLPVAQQQGRGRVRMSVRRECRNGVEIDRAGGSTFRPRRFACRAANYVSYFLSACLAGVQLRRPDVVVSLTDPPIIGLAAFLVARRSGAKFVFLCQDIFPEVARLLEDFHSEALNRCLDGINRFLIRKADRVVALGDTMRHRLVDAKAADPSKVIVIHNWADCAAIVPGPKRNPFSLANGLADAFVVMHSGNIGLSQNLDTLLDAAAELSNEAEVVVAVVGDGAKRPALETRARSEGIRNVRFFPYQPKERLRDSFASADVFIVSLKPGLAGYIVPSKLYGILAAGRPYVAAVEDACEVAAITRRHDCGLLAEPGKAADLAEKILKLYYDRPYARRLASRARRAALEFDRPRQVSAYYELFQGLMRESARGVRA